MYLLAAIDELVTALLGEVLFRQDTLRMVVVVVCTVFVSLRYPVREVVLRFVNGSCEGNSVTSGDVPGHPGVCPSDQTFWLLHLQGPRARRR